MNTKKLKTMVTAILLLCTVTAFSQTKEETVKYISDLYRKSYQYTDSGTKVKTIAESVTLDGKTLMLKLKRDDGKEHSVRRYLMDYGTLKIAESENSFSNYGKYYITDGSSKQSVLWHITLENDAKRLKNALEHLIKILKTEPETDPFAN